MQTVNEIDIEKGAFVCAEAFKMDDLDCYFFSEKESRIVLQKKLYRFLLNSSKDNIITTSENIEGLIIWEKPYTHGSHINISEMLMGLPLLFDFGITIVRKILKYQIFSEKLRKSIIKDPYWYLNMVVVDPFYQGKGYASRLIRPTLMEAEREKESVYLETHNRNNIILYEQYGFKVIHSEKVDNTEIEHFCMIKEVK